MTTDQVDAAAAIQAIAQDMENCGGWTPAYTRRQGRRLTEALGRLTREEVGEEENKRTDLS